MRGVSCGRGNPPLSANLGRTANQPAQEYVQTQLDPAK